MFLVVPLWLGSFLPGLQRLCVVGRESYGIQQDLKFLLQIFYMEKIVATMRPGAVRNLISGF